MGLEDILLQTFYVDSELVFTQNNVNSYINTYDVFEPFFGLTRT